MPRRQILNARQRAALFDLPTDQETLLRHYTLADDDIEHIQSRRRAHNRFGFALQLCVFRYPGRLLMPGDVIPSEITEFLAAQLGLNPDDLVDYAHRAETRREHLADLRVIYGYRTSNPIESAFATIRHRTKRTKGCLSRNGMLHMMFKLGQCAEKSWRKLRGFAHLADVRGGRGNSDQLLRWIA